MAVRGWLRGSEDGLGIQNQVFGFGVEVFNTCFGVALFYGYIIWGSNVGLIKVHTRSLDYSSSSVK